MLKRISDVESLMPALHHIAQHKNYLAMQARGWVNIIGLYVQGGVLLVNNEPQEYLAAGGKFRKYFYAVTDDRPDDDPDASIANGRIVCDSSYWRVKKFDQQTWKRRFARLVEPTCEIAWCLAKEKEYSPSKFMDVINHFKSTGEWLGLHDNKCTCGQYVSWWDRFSGKPCTHCGVKLEAPADCNGLS